MQQTEAAHLTDAIDGQVAHIRSLGELSQGIDGVLYRGGVPSAVSGAVIKHYSYDRFDEVEVFLCQNGAIFHEIGKGDEWFAKPVQQRAFDKAKLRGARSSALNRMMR